MSNNKLELSSLTDEQKMWITQMSYLDLNSKGMEILRQGGSIKVSDLDKYLDGPNKICVGNMAGLAGWSMGGKTPASMTNQELLDAIQEKGLGDLKIVGCATYDSTGFQALAFSDTAGNTGISYRGTDVDLSKGGQWDILHGDMAEFFRGESTQQRQALSFFNKIDNKFNCDYIYGYSLGGNLADRVYLANHDKLKENFTLNGYPIDQKLLNTPDKVAAFNDSTKYHRFAVEDDWVSKLKDCSKYQNNINWIDNSGNLDKNLFNKIPMVNFTMWALTKGQTHSFVAHMPQAAAIGENGNFIIDGKEREEKWVAQPYVAKPDPYAEHIRNPYRQEIENQEMNEQELQDELFWDTVEPEDMENNEIDLGELCKDEIGESYQPVIELDSIEQEKTRPQLGHSLIAGAQMAIENVKKAAESVEIEFDR